MKSLILLATLSMSSLAMSSEVLLSMTKGSGFGPIASHTSLTITENGEVTKMLSQARHVRRISIGKLSANAIANLKDKIETIADNTTLVNLDIKKPRCMDAPSTNLTVTKGGKEIRIAAVQMCQRYQSKDAETKSLLELAQSFDYLAE